MDTILHYLYRVVLIMKYTSVTYCNNKTIPERFVLYRHIICRLNVTPTYL